MLPIRRKGQHLSFGKILQRKISWILRREERQENVSKGVSLLLHFPSFVQYRADDVVRLLRKLSIKIWRECSAALHHKQDKDELSYSSGIQ